MSMTEIELLDQFEEQQSELWREVSNYAQQVKSIASDQEELQAQARERGIPPGREWELMREAALELHSYVISNFANGTVTGPPQKPSWRKVISPEAEQRRTMDAFDPMREQIQEYQKTRSQVHLITYSSHPEHIEALLKEDDILMAIIDAYARDIQIALATLGRFALIIDEAEPPGTRFPKIVGNALGTPRLKKRSEHVHEQERSAEVYYAGSQFTEGQFSKFETPELLDPEFKLSRKYIRQGILGKNADRAITDRLKTESNRIGLTPKNPVIADESERLDRIRRNPDEIDPETFESSRDFAGDEVVELSELIEDANEKQVALMLLNQFESTLTDDLKTLHQRYLVAGVGLAQIRKELGLSLSDEKTYQNRLKRFYERSFCEKHFCQKNSQNECPHCQPDAEPGEIA